MIITFVVLQEGDSEVAAKMQDLALAEGALPRHLHTAMYTQSTDNRLLTNRCDELTAKCTINIIIYFPSFKYQFFSSCQSMLIPFEIKFLSPNGVQCIISLCRFSLFDEAYGK